MLSITEKASIKEETMWKSLCCLILRNCQSHPNLQEPPLYSGRSPQQINPSNSRNITTPKGSGDSIFQQ